MKGDGVPVAEPTYPLLPLLPALPDSAAQEHFHTDEATQEEKTVSFLRLWEREKEREEAVLCFFNPRFIFQYRNPSFCGLFADVILYIINVFKM